MITKVRSHDWILHMVCPVEVINIPGKEPGIFVDPDERVLAESNAVYGCATCSTPLTIETAASECWGTG